MSTLTRRGFLQTTGAAGAALALAPGVAPAAEPAAGAGAGFGPIAEPPFKLGTVSYMIAAEWDVPTVIKVCKNVGLAAFEARTTHKHGIEPSLSKDQRKEVRKQFEDSGGVMFWGCGSTCEFHSPDQSVVQQNIETCKRFVELVADCGGKGVKVRPNGLPKDIPPEKTLEQIGKALVPCGQAAADAGVEIWVEVHGGGTAHPPNMKAIMDHCGHPAVGVTWNSNRDDLKDGSVAEYFRLLRPHIKSCHINQIYNDAAGAYPYRELFRLLRESGYDRYTLIEVGKAMPTPDAGEEMLRYYKALWLELARG